MDENKSAAAVSDEVILLFEPAAAGVHCTKLRVQGSQIPYSRRK